MTLPRLITPGCGLCVHFAACRKLKNVKADTTYCQFRPSKFEHATLKPIGSADAV